MITSPYNFVPLSDKVVMPFWANHVSHDIPFKDSQSGVLKLKLKAESPIYVRNGVPKSINKDDNEAKSFNNIDGHYFIPGSSIKGMLRTVMEIMSFGRMGNKVNDHRYSVRDFQNDTIYPKSDLSKEALCGWLYKKDGQFFLDDCGKPGRVSQKELDKLCIGMPKISDYYKEAQNITKNNKSSEAKNKLFSFEKGGHKFILDFIDVERPVYKLDQNGKPGTIVFTGQPGVRKEPDHQKASGKHLEFIFFEPKCTEVPVEKEAIDNFFFAYYDHEKAQQKDDWKWRKPQLDKGKKIPIFFRINPDGSIKDMGLSLLYKIIYKNSVVDAINFQQSEADSFDLAETIFGYTDNKSALKGRVHVGHAFTEKNVRPIDEKLEVLAGPKASFYPNYIEQNNEKGKREKIKGKYQTFMDDAKIRGWKRYPIHSGEVKRNPPPEIKGRINEKVGTKFVPLPAHTDFTFDIHYHNLRKEEFGALISAITFHNTNGLYHSIGSGKPLGYGKSTIEIINLSEEVKLEMLKAYELFMDCELGNSSPLWFQSDELKELFAMAKPDNDDNNLKYMKLEEFAGAKGKRRDDPKFALQYYSFISNNKVDVKPISTEQDLKAALRNYQIEKQLLERQQNMETLKENLISKNKEALENALQNKKNELIAQLAARKEDILEKERKELALMKEDERRKRVMKGLPTEWQSVDSFRNLCNRIPAWEKLQPDQKIPEAFKNELAAILRNIIENELSKSKTKRNWKGSFAENKNWGMITIWLGESRAQSLFNELNQTK